MGTSAAPPKSTEDYNFLKFDILGVGSITLPALIINAQARMEGQWDEFSEIGRADPKVLLGKFSKTVDLDFLVVATGHGGTTVEKTLEQLELLSKVTTPNYSVASNAGYQGVFVKWAFGGLYRNQFFYVNSLGYTWDNEGITWHNVESGSTALPVISKVNMTLQYVGRMIPSVQTRFFG